MPYQPASCHIREQTCRSLCHSSQLREAGQKFYIPPHGRCLCTSGMQQAFVHVQTRFPNPMQDSRHSGLPSNRRQSEEFLRSKASMKSSEEFLPKKAGLRQSDDTLHTKSGTPPEDMANPSTVLPDQSSLEGTELPDGTICYYGNTRSHKGSADSLEEVAQKMSQKAQALHSQGPNQTQGLQGKVIESTHSRMASHIRSRDERHFAGHACILQQVSLSCNFSLAIRGKRC